VLLQSLCHAGPTQTVHDMIHGKVIVHNKMQQLSRLLVQRVVAIMWIHMHDVESEYPQWSVHHVLWTVPPCTLGCPLPTLEQMYILLLQSLCRVPHVAAPSLTCKR